MHIRIKIHGGKAIHAAEYNPGSGRLSLFCNSLKYDNYLAEVYDLEPPTAENITCRKCLKIV